MTSADLNVLLALTILAVLVFVFEWITRGKKKKNSQPAPQPQQTVLYWHRLDNALCLVDRTDGRITHIIQRKPGMPGWEYNFYPNTPFLTELDAKKAAEQEYARYHNSYTIEDEKP